MWAPDYVTPAQLRAYVRIDDLQDEEQIALAISAASRAINQACDRQFGLQEGIVQRFYTAQFDRNMHRWLVDIDDLMIDDTLQVHVDTADDGTYADEITQFRLYPVNAAADGRPWTRIVVHPSSPVQPSRTVWAVRVTGQPGWTYVPKTIEEATLLQASRFLFRRDAPAGIAGSPDQGSEIRLLAKVDPDVRVALRNFVRPWRFS